MPIPRFAPTDDSAAMLAALRQTGVVIVERLYDDATLGRLMADLGPWLAKAPVGGGKFFGGAMKRVHALAARAPVVGDMLTNPVLTGLADAVLLENCRNYRVQVLSLFQVWKGGRLQPLHRDVGVYEHFLIREPGGKEILLSFIVAVSDFTAENGATRIVPGSHTWPRERIAQEEEIEAAEMPKGSIVIYLGSLLHGAAINVTDQPRSAIVSGFAVGWLRQEENQYLSCPPEAAARLSSPAQHLLGYRCHSPILGWSDDRNPEDLLGPRKTDPDAAGYKAQDLQNV